MSTLTAHPMIVQTPGCCGGKPRIDGHRIRVQDVVGLYFARGLSVEEIGEAFPSVTLSQIHAALAYYHDHREEIDEQMANEDAFAEQFMKDHPDSVRRWDEREAEGPC